MRPTRFDLGVWITLGALVCALSLLVVSLNWIGVRILHTFPDVGGVVDQTGRVGIEFSQPMQANSAQPQLQIEPDVSGTTTWGGSSLWFRPNTPFQPGSVYTASLPAGAMSLGGLNVKQDVVWQFQAAAPWVVYLSKVEGPIEVWRVPSSGGAPQQLTHTGGKVYDFAVSTGTRQIVYSVVNARQGIDLWLADGDGANPRQLLDCGPDLCFVPAWSPDGTQIAFSRQGAGLAPGAPLSPPRVWTIVVDTGQAKPVYQDSQVLGYGPSWSPDGRRVAVYDGGSGNLRTLDPFSGDEMLLPTQLGEMGTWSPDGRRLLYVDLSSAVGEPYTTLFVADVATHGITAVAGGEPNQAQYGQPAWSPADDWVAVTQAVPTLGRGRQVWLMHPDGSDPHALTSDPQYSYGDSQWDPWGQALVFQRFAIDQPFPVPEIVTWSEATGQFQVLAQDASEAKWLP